MWFFSKKQVKLPNELYEFPIFMGTVKKGPMKSNTRDYLRYTYIVDGSLESELSVYKDNLRAQGYIQKNEVRFDRGIENTYIIIERDGNNFRLVYHKGK